MAIDDVVCLLCHTVHTESVLGDPSRSWRCSRCGQLWDASRLAAVMDYQRWVKTQAASISSVAAA